MRLQKLLTNPRNQSDRKANRLRWEACERHYAELERIGQMIHEMDQWPEFDALSPTRVYLVGLQVQFANDLRDAGFPMEGNVRADIKKKPRTPTPGSFIALGVK